MGPQTWKARRGQRTWAQLVLVAALVAPSAGWSQAPATREDGSRGVDESTPTFTDGGLKLSASFGAASDYLFRGRSWSDSQPAMFAGADVERGDVYTGAWLTNVRSVASDVKGAGRELDLYAGWRGQVSGNEIDLGAIRYDFAGLSRMRTTGRATFGRLGPWGPHRQGSPFRPRRISSVGWDRPPISKRRSNIGSAHSGGCRPPSVISPSSERRTTWPGR